MNVPETRYAKSGDAHIAYQVAGEGPFDVVYVPGGFRMSRERGRSRTTGGCWSGWRRSLG